MSRIAQFGPIISIDLDNGHIDVDFVDSFLLVVDDGGNKTDDQTVEPPDILDRILGEGIPTSFTMSQPATQVAMLRNLADAIEDRAS